MTAELICGRPRTQHPIQLTDVVGLQFPGILDDEGQPNPMARVIE